MRGWLKLTNIVITEFEKLKRYSILWIGVVAVFFVSALAVFQTASGGTMVTYEAFSSILFGITLVWVFLSSSCLRVDISLTVNTPMTH